MYRFFEELPSGRNDVLTFEDLADAYWTSKCAPQLRGILHDVARRGSNNSRSPLRDVKDNAVAFLLQIASEAEEIEENESLRRLAFELFCQRVLPHVHGEMDAREAIVRFFATEPQVHTRIKTAHRENVYQFLLREWGHNANKQGVVDRDMLVDATIGAGAYGLLVRLTVLDAIHKLWDLLSKQPLDDEWPGPLQCAFWKELSATSDFEDLRYSLLRHDEQRTKFQQDVRYINAVCGEILTPKDAHTKRPTEAAAALLALVSILHHRIFG